MISKKDQNADNVLAALNDPKQKDFCLENISVRVLKAHPEIVEAYIAAGKFKRNGSPIRFLQENNIPVTREMCLNACLKTSYCYAWDNLFYTPRNIIDHTLLMEVVSAKPQAHQEVLHLGRNLGIYPMSGLSPELIDLLHEAIIPKAYIREKYGEISDNPTEEDMEGILSVLPPMMHMLPTSFLVAAVEALEEKQARAAEKNP